MKQKLSTKSYLIAPCGMNCAICMAYLREKNKCPGCRDFNKDVPVSIARCKIKNCQELNKNKFKFCFECKKYPCILIKHMDKRYKTKYYMSIIENLENIKNKGIRIFIKNEKVRWTCSQCAGPICVHKGFCYNCGKKIR